MATASAERVSGGDCGVAYRAGRTAMQCGASIRDHPNYWTGGFPDAAATQAWRDGWHDELAARVRALEAGTVRP